jgi:hypothetical protein
MIPTLPPFFDMQFTNKETGRLTQDGLLFNDQLWQSLNIMLTLVNSIITSAPGSNSKDYVNQGLVAPSFTTTQINAFAAETQTPLGSIWFNTTTAKLQVLTATGVVQTITST